jgi:hypothetical protein
MSTTDAPQADYQPYHYPIIYVRGYAMTRGEMDDTTADPFCGFNLGSTVLRAVPDRDCPPRKFIFESPIVRLATEHGYRDVYESGFDILDDGWEKDIDGNDTGNRLSRKSIIIHRYYDEASSLLGTKDTPTIEKSAQELGALILRVRDLVCKNEKNGLTPKTFRCYLVAHSMGGLVCRALLQNPKLDRHDVHKLVDKFFTYATPHNGIDVGGVNIPSFLSPLKINNFDRDKVMPKYLNLSAELGRVDLIPEDRFPSRKVFCMVGTNRLDYEAALGLSRAFVGHGSDGLVRIENATLCGLNTDGTIGGECAKAFAFRSHSGPFGIVNSEEAFQNLNRFLFGNLRVDIWMDIEDIRLPAALEKHAGKVDGLYKIELKASPRGKLWQLTRRTVSEDSAACVRHSTWKTNRSLYLSSVFLANSAKMDPEDPSLSYIMEIAVCVPDYEVKGILWTKDHYEGADLFANTLIVSLVPPTESDDKRWGIRYIARGQGIEKATAELDTKKFRMGPAEVSIPFDSVVANEEGKLMPALPGIKGRLRLVASEWNA